jgi:alkaline phosphatase
MRRLCIAAAGFLLIAGGAAPAQTVYPIDRAEMLAGSRFDFKVEFPGLADPAKVAVTLNGDDYAKVFGKAAVFVAREDDEPRSALILRDVSLPKPGTYALPVMASIPARSHGRSTKPARARRRMSSFSSATACRPRTAPRRASSPKASAKAKRAASLSSTTCRIWRW